MLTMMSAARARTLKSAGSAAAMRSWRRHSMIRMVIAARMKKIRGGLPLVMVGVSQTARPKIVRHKRVAADTQHTLEGGGQVVTAATPRPLT